MTLKGILGSWLLTAVALPLLVHAQQCSSCPDIIPNDATSAWDLLIKGNGLFAGGSRQSGKTALDICRRRCTSDRKQGPFAVVLSCADSRVPAEMVFDQRVGDLFVVRVAGNVASDEAIGSIEYALKHLLRPPKIIVVLGHQKCGAVEAALNGPAHDLIPSILNRIYPAVEGLKPDQLDTAIDANVALTVKLLPKYSPVIRDFGSQNIRGAYYSLDSGLVTALPRQR